MTTIDPTTMIRIAELRDVASLRQVQGIVEAQLSALQLQVNQLREMQKLVDERINELG